MPDPPLAGDPRFDHDSTDRAAQTQVPASVPREAAPDAVTWVVQLPAATPAAAGGQPAPRSDWPLPEEVGGFPITSRIARGGMGIVYQARDQQLGREIAVKVLRPDHLGNSVLARRFVDEARINGRLEHPGIVPVYQINRGDSAQPYIAMMLADGQTLARVLSQRKDPAAELPHLLKIFDGICQTIAYTHSRDVIHRDLKPENVMVGEFGVVKVMDWGIAKDLRRTAEAHREPDLSERPASSAAALSLDYGQPVSDSARMADSEDLIETEFGTILGTPAYLPPEQARGQTEQMNKSSDVFALGGILCEILTGHPPYTGETISLIFDKAYRAQLDEAFARLDACAAERDLVVLAKWCLDPDPARRPRDAGVVAQSMTAWLESDLRRVERDLVRFFELSLDMFCIAGLDGYFRRVNQNFPRLLGYPASQLVSRPFMDFVHPEDVTATRQAMTDLDHGCPVIRFRNRYRHLGGHYLWLEWTAQSIPDEGVIYAVARDVTELVADAAVHQRRETIMRFQEAGQDASEDSVIACGTDGRIISWNTAAERLTGLSARETAGLPVSQLILPGERPVWDSLLNRVIQGHQPGVERLTCLCRDGTSVTARIRAVPVRDRQQQIIGAVLVVRSVTTDVAPG